MGEPAPPEEPERVFCEPWQAHVFAFAMKLSQAGQFTWAEWGEHFGAHLKTAVATNRSADDHRPMPEVDSASYYDVWLDALESLLIQRGLASADDLGQLKEAWTKAYLHTPYGMPVEFRGRDRAHDSHTQGAGRD